VTCLRRSEIFKHEFVANLLASPSVKKKFENRLIFSWCLVFGLTVYITILTQFKTNLSYFN